MCSFDLTHVTVDDVTRESTFDFKAHAKKMLISMPMGVGLAAARLLITAGFVAAVSGGALVTSIAVRAAVVAALGIPFSVPLYKEVMRT